MNRSGVVKFFIVLMAVVLIGFMLFRMASGIYHYNMTRFESILKKEGFVRQRSGGEVHYVKSVNGGKVLYDVNSIKENVWSVPEFDCSITKMVENNDFIVFTLQIVDYEDDSKNSVYLQLVRSRVTKKVPITELDSLGSEKSELEDKKMAEMLWKKDVEDIRAEYEFVLGVVK